MAASLKQPMDPKTQSHQNEVTKRRKRNRFRRSRSAPIKMHLSEETAGDSTDDSSNSKSLLNKTLHPSLRKVASALIIYLAISVTCFYLLRRHLSGKKTNPILDSLYFSVATMTASGYGDLVPQTALSKLFVCAFVFSGMAVVALILSKAANYLVEKQEILLVKAFAYQSKSEPNEVLINRVIQTKTAAYKCAMAFVFQFILVIAGTLFLKFHENMGFVEAFYCVCCITTTLGYGYPSFSSLGGRIFAIVWILMSTICLTLCFLYLTEVNAEKRQKCLVERVLSRHLTHYDLEAADLDDNGVVDAAEFALFKLKEMGKISEEDVSLVIKEFQELDVDQSGTISAADVTLIHDSSPCTTQK